MTGVRTEKKRVKTAKKRSTASTQWLARQLNDPYVAQAKRDGYRSRAAYKLVEMDEKFHLLKAGMRVLDLGAAPGGWTQVAIAKIGEKGFVLGLDLLPISPIPGATLLQMDFMADDAPDKIKAALGGQANLVMSDMAGNTTGHTPTDHIRIISLCETAYDFAKQVLAPNGAFICKVLRGGTENDLLKMMKQDFTSVKHTKPKSSRSDSAESYVVATGFRG